MIFNDLSATELEEIASLLELRESFTNIDIQQINNSNSDIIFSELKNLVDESSNESIAKLIKAIAIEKKRLFTANHESLELVWTGPEILGMYDRDTRVVAMDLFARAEETIYISTYGFYNSDDILKPLFENLKNNPQLKVRLFINIKNTNKYDDASETIKNFKRIFFKYQWNSDCKPEIFYDPRSLEFEEKKTICLAF